MCCITLYITISLNSLHNPSGIMIYIGLPAVASVGRQGFSCLFGCLRTGRTGCIHISYVTPFCRQRLVDIRELFMRKLFMPHFVLSDRPNRCHLPLLGCVLNLRFFLKLKIFPVDSDLRGDRPPKVILNRSSERLGRS